MNVVVAITAADAFEVSDAGHSRPLRSLRRVIGPFIPAQLAHISVIGFV
jgi:hypothetical protein